MKTALTILTTCLVLLTVGTLALLVRQHQQARELAGINQRLILELQESRETVAELTREKSVTSERVTTLQASGEELRRRVDSLEEAERAAAAALPRPYRVRAYLGQDNVGGAWIIPHNVTRDSQSGRYVYEPVLLIDTSARNYFTEYRTNVVEREVRTAEVYDNYYPYYYHVSHGKPHGTNRPPAGPWSQPQPVPGSGMPSPPPSLRAQLFAPPMSIVNSRPQVLGRPATSPINAKMFAP